MNRHLALAVLFTLVAFSAEAQRPRDFQRPTRPPNPRIPGRGPAGLENAADQVSEWAKVRAADGARVCRYQAILNTFIAIDNAMDPMQPNVSAAKAVDLVSNAGRRVPTDNESVSYQLRNLVIVAKEIFDPHASPNIPLQRERFHREVLEPAARIVTPEVIAFVEKAQQLDIALQAVTQAQSEMAALIVHAIHGDCSANDNNSHFE